MKKKSSTVNRKNQKKSSPITNVPWGWKMLAFVIFWYGIASMFLAIFILVVTGVVDPLSEEPMKVGSDAENLFIICMGLITLAGIFAVLAPKKKFLSSLGFRKFSIKKAAIAILITLLVMYGVNLALEFIMESLVRGYDASKEYGPDPATWSSWWLATFAAVAIAPVLEEVVFRGVAFPVIARRFGLIVAAIIVSLVFAAGHWSLVGSPATFTVGLILCYMYVHFRSIIPGILLHTANNLLFMLSVIPK